jgi:hypothetical protein
MVLIINDAGTITAFRTTPIAGKPLAAPKPAPAPEKDGAAIGNVQAPGTPTDQGPATPPTPPEQK